MSSDDDIFMSRGQGLTPVDRERRAKNASRARIQRFIESHGEEGVVRYCKMLAEHWAEYQHPRRIMQGWLSMLVLVKMGETKGDLFQVACAAWASQRDLVKKDPAVVRKLEDALGVARGHLFDRQPSDPYNLFTGERDLDLDV